MSIVQRIFGGADDVLEDAKEADPLEAGLDRVFDMLANPRRRYVVDIVGDLDRNESTTVGALATGLAYVENDEFDHPREVVGQARKRCYVSLYQTHLPTMDSAGALDYDRRGKTVSPTGATDRLQKLVRAGYREASAMGWSA